MSLKKIRGYISRDTFRHLEEPSSDSNSSSMNYPTGLITLDF